MHIQDPFHFTFQTYTREPERQFLHQLDIIPELNGTNPIDWHPVLELVVGRVVCVLHEHLDGLVVEAEN